jgi:hypothetical protein
MIIGATQYQENRSHRSLSRSRDGLYRKAECIDASIYTLFATSIPDNQCKYKEKEK